MRPQGLLSQVADEVKNICRNLSLPSLPNAPGGIRPSAGSGTYTSGSHPEMRPGYTHSLTLRCPMLREALAHRWAAELNFPPRIPHGDYLCLVLGCRAMLMSPASRHCRWGVGEIPHVAGAQGGRWSSVHVGRTAPQTEPEGIGGTSFDRKTLAAAEAP